MNNDRLISLNAAIVAMMKLQAEDIEAYGASIPEGFDGDRAVTALKALPSAQPERLTDDDFETIRILLNADKEKLCNQRRWKEAEEYQRIIDRFMAFASAQQTGAECVAPITIEGDGTLMVTVGKNANISRVIVLYGDSIFCGVFYPDGEKDGENG